MRHAGGIYGYVSVAYDFDSSGKFLGLGLAARASPSQVKHLLQIVVQRVASEAVIYFPVPKLLMRNGKFGSQFYWLF
jgi:hypothetical protein